MLKSVFSCSLGGAGLVSWPVSVWMLAVCRLCNFCRQLRHQYRCGQVDGSEWFMPNEWLKGAPPARNLMNILFEPFHRWAAAQKKGVVHAAADRQAQAHT